MSGFEKFKEKVPEKNEFYSSLGGNELVIKSINMLSKIGVNLE